MIKTGEGSYSGMDEPFKFDSERGIITGTKTGTRLFMFAVLPNSVALAKIFDTFGSGAAVMLQVLGKGYGSGLFSSLNKVWASPQDIISFLVEASRNLGWGKALMTGDMEKGTLLNLEMQNCVMCENLKRSGESSCYFLGGVVQGILEQMYGDQFFFKEERCKCKGDSDCTFVFRRSI